MVNEFNPSIKVPGYNKWLCVRYAICYHSIGIIYLALAFKILHQEGKETSKGLKDSFNFSNKRPIQSQVSEV